jgi:hypothetical protein
MIITHHGRTYRIDSETDLVVFLAAIETLRTMRAA